MFEALSDLSDSWWELTKLFQLNGSSNIQIEFADRIAWKKCKTKIALKTQQNCLRSRPLPLPSSEFKLNFLSFISLSAELNGHKFHFYCIFLSEKACLVARNELKFVCWKRGEKFEAVKMEKLKSWWRNFYLLGRESCSFSVGVKIVAR